jgi:exopolysaccharide biosynthesis protein
MNPKLSFIAALLFTAAVARADWTNVAPGVDYQEFTGDSTDIHVTRIDLSNESLQVVVSRESERGLKVSDFAKKNKAIVAINGDYFDDKFSPIGLTIGPCGPWTGSKDTKREGVVAFGEHKASIRRQSEVMDPPDPWVAEAISGWPALIVNCEVVKPLPGSAAFTASPHPRTAVGLSQDHKTLYLVVAEGRRTGVPGLTLAQLAAFMHDELDACAAMNLDGGGSAALWVGDHIVNRLSDGVERKVGNHIGIIRRTDFAACDSTVEPTLQSRANGEAVPLQQTKQNH